MRDRRVGVVPLPYREHASSNFPDPLRPVGIRETIAIDERGRLELAEAANRVLGERAGLTLMELLPPVGWADVATKHDLAALEARIDLRFDAVDLRFAAVDQRFDALEQRFDALERRFDGVDGHLDSVLDARLDGLRHELLDAFHRDQIALTWRYLGVTGSMFLGFSALVTLVVSL